MVDVHDVVDLTHEHHPEMRGINRVTFRQYRTDTVMEKSSTVVPAASSSLEAASPSPPIVAKQV